MTDPFRRRLLLVVLAAFALRVGYVVVIGADPLAGDAARYSAVGQAISAGRGYVDPFVFDESVPAAEHPPAASAVLAVAPAVMGTDRMYRGLTAFVFGQRLTFALVGALTVGMIGIVGRHLAGGVGSESISPADGDRIGLIAAGLAALNPNLWVNDGLLMSESLAALSVAVVVWAAYRAWESRTWQRWAVLGGVCGAATLVRSEALSLLVVTVLPMLWWCHRDRVVVLVRMVAAVALPALAVVSLWVVPNLVRFAEPVAWSTNDGLTLMGANCPDTYRGELVGLWSLTCTRFVDGDGNGRDDWSDLLARKFGEVPPDPSVLSTAYRAEAVSYVRSHLGDLPKVAAVRVARVWGVFRPGQMVDYNRGEGRRAAVSWLCWAWYLLSMPLAIAGIVFLRRRKVAVWPLVSQAVCVTITAVTVYGLARFRIGWDVAATLAVAVAVEELLRRRRPAA